MRDGRRQVRGGKGEEKNKWKVMKPGSETEGEEIKEEGNGGVGGGGGGSLRGVQVLGEDKQTILELQSEKVT